MPLRIRRGDDGGDALDVRLCLFQRDPWFAAGVGEVRPAPRFASLGDAIERNPHLGVAARIPRLATGSRNAGGMTPVTV